MKLATILALSSLAVPAAAQDFQAVRVGTSAGRPIALDFAPGVSHQAYIATKLGKIWRFAGGSYVSPAFLDISWLVNDAGEGGLLGFVFDPEFDTNGYFYVSYTSGNGHGDSVVSRFSVMPGSVDQADPNSETILFGPYPHITEGHKGGAIAFGPDGHLYVAMGDGDAGSALGLDVAQDLSDARGKILRLDVRAGAPWVPADNPYVGVAGTDERIWAAGFRNPFKLDIDSATGDVYVADVGLSTWEEVTRLPGGVGGLNGGWPCMEGPDCRDLAGCDCAGGGFTAPLHSLVHGPPDNACAIMGGAFVRGSRIASLEGQYLFNDFCSARFYGVADAGGTPSTNELPSIVDEIGGPIRYIVDMTVGPDGDVWFVSHYGAAVWKLEPRGEFGVYCSTAPNSTGNPASIVASGSTSVSAADLTLTVSDLPPDTFGFFLISQSQVFVPQFNGSQGTLCVGPSINRWGYFGLSSDRTGVVTFTSDLTNLPPHVEFRSGDTWNFQYWTRDANPTVTSNTSNAASVLFSP